MGELLSWLEAHSELSGWAQFLGTVLALAVTYFTAFAPHWRRKNQLKKAAERLLANGYEVIESYHRTSSNFRPFAQSVRHAGVPMHNVAEEINRFPVFELEDQGRNSVARRLNAMGHMLRSTKMLLDLFADQFEVHGVDDQSCEDLRNIINKQHDLAQKLFVGAELTRPEWPLSADDPASEQQTT